MTVVSDRRASFDERVILLVLVGSAVALGLGVYGNVHDPSGRALVILFFTATINLKAWLLSP